MLHIVLECNVEYRNLSIIPKRGDPRKFGKRVKDKVGKKAGNTHISQDGGKYW